jgi:hypothetical protein
MGAREADRERRIAEAEACIGRWRVDRGGSSIDHFKLAFTNILRAATRSNWTLTMRAAGRPIVHGVKTRRDDERDGGGRHPFDCDRAKSSRQAIPFDTHATHTRVIYTLRRAIFCSVVLQRGESKSDKLPRCENWKNNCQAERNILVSDTKELACTPRVPERFRRCGRGVATIVTMAAT